tara:strand:- start:2563 stop:2826 length:264 start_codon:yes stop_codon:yes gene_type:complete
MNSQYETVWEMVYHNPSVIDGPPSRLLLKRDRKNPEVLKGEELFHWLADHKDQVARAVVKALKSRTKQSKYQFIAIFKVPFYTDVIN